MVLVVVAAVAVAVLVVVVNVVSHGLACFFFLHISIAFRFARTHGV